jgi:hypothetical protein
LRKKCISHLTGLAMALIVTLGGAGIASAEVVSTNLVGEVIEYPSSAPQIFAIDPASTTTSSTTPSSSVHRALELAKESRGANDAQLRSRVGWIPGIDVNGELLTLEVWSASDFTGDFYVFAMNHGARLVLSLITPKEEQGNAAVGKAWLLASAVSTSPVSLTIVDIPVALFQPENHDNDVVEILCTSQGGLIYSLASIALCQANLVCAGSAALLYAGACGGPFSGRYFGWQNYGNDPPYQTDKAYHMPSSFVGEQILLNPDWRAEFPYCDPLHGDGVTCWFLNPLTTQYEVRTTTVHGTYLWPDGSQSFYSRTCTCKSMPNDGLAHSRFYTVPANGSYLLTVLGNFSFFDSTGHYRLDAGSLRKYHIVGG